VSEKLYLIREIVGMNIALKPEQEQFVQSQIDRGRFKSPDEAAFQAFKLLEEKYQDYEDWIEDTRQKVDVAISELDRGEGVELDVAIERLQQKFRSAKETT
jgi:antitoxin ParD1/3/4